MEDLRYVLKYVSATGRFFVYEWTPAIVRKKDMTPLTTEEAKFYIGLLGSGIKTLPGDPKSFRNEDNVFDSNLYQAAIAAKLKGTGPQVIDIPKLPEQAIKSRQALEAEEAITFQEENPVLQNAETAPQEGGKPLSWTQEQLLALEVEKIRTILKKADLEAYMLKNHRIPLAPGTMVAMKEEARAALLELSKRNDLHLTTIS